jgi:uncharacterized protein (TIGR03437 family)
VSPGQINFLVPDRVANGTATFAVAGGGAAVSMTGTVQAVAPALFSMSGTGSGVAAALAVAVQPANPQAQTPVPVFQCDAGGCAAVPIVLGVDQPVYVSFYGTGIRDRSALANVTVTIGGVAVAPAYAGAAPGFAGLDQVNAALPLSLRGSGETTVSITVDGQTSNVVTITIQ